MINFLIFIVKGFNIIPTMKTVSKNTKYKRNCPKCAKILYYNNTSSLNLAERENKVCRSCVKIGTKTKKNHPEKIKKICEWSGDEFWVTWKKRNARFKDRKSMYEWRKSQNHENVKCLNCGTLFDRYKNILHIGTRLPQQYCSNYCNLTSNEKKKKLQIWGNSDKNHWKTKKSQKQVKKTKLEKYGDENYNNINKQIETSMKKYGVPYNILLGKSNGKRISKGQQNLYEELKKTNPDIQLEVWLPDVKKSVDIFIPSKNKIIEYFGNYWHCNPKKYKDEYFHTIIKKSAKEIWERDKERIDLLEGSGYNVEVVWEK